MHDRFTHLSRRQSEGGSSRAPRLRLKGGPPQPPRTGSANLAARAAAAPTMQSAVDPASAQVPGHPSPRFGKKRVERPDNRSQ